MASIYDLYNEITGNTQIANTILILDEDYNRIFPGLSLLGVGDNTHDTIMYHPLETGAQIADHKINNPIEIRFLGMLVGKEYESTFLDLDDARLNNKKLVVQTLVKNYEDMYIVAIPNEQNGEIYSGARIQITFQQAQFVTPQFGVLPKNPVNSNTVSTGTKQATDATTEQTAKAADSASTIAPKAA